MHLVRSYSRCRPECPADFLEGLGGNVGQRAIVGTAVPWAGRFASAGPMVGHPHSMPYCCMLLRSRLQARQVEVTHASIHLRRGGAWCGRRLRPLADA
eukprot:2891634-Pyramimonas_sp.AAC.1